MSDDARHSRTLANHELQRATIQSSPLRRQTSEQGRGLRQGFPSVRGAREVVTQSAPVTLLRACPARPDEIMRLPQEAPENNQLRRLGCDRCDLLRIEGRRN